MAQILQGAGGTPVLDEDMLEKMRASGKAYAVEGADPRIIQAGSVGNATIPMAQYITGTGPEIDLGYTYEPYIPEDKIADIMAKQKEEAEGDDSLNGSGSDGPPEPGEPGYEQYMMYEAGPDFAHDAHNAKSMDQMIGEGYLSKAIAMQNNNIPGFIGTGISQLGKFNQDYYNKYMDKTYGDAGYTGDGPGEADYQGSSPSDFAGTDAPSGDQGVGGMSGGAGEFGIFNQGGKVNSYGYGGPVAEQEDPYATMPVAKAAPMAPLQGALAANQVNSQYQKPWYQQMGQAAGTSVMSNILMKGIGMAIPGLGLNKGGKVCPCGTPGCPGCGKGYNNGGRPTSIWKRHDGSFNPIPVAPRHTSKHMPAELQEPVGDPTKHFSYDRFDRDWYARADANPSMRKVDPSFTYRGWQGPSTIRIPSGSRADSTMPPELQSPVGKRVLKESGPLSIKNQIAIKESEAKIKREDMKAYADVYKKMKGPLQGE